MPFPLSLTTSTLNECRIGWFDSDFWSPKPRDLLSSLIQHERLAPFFMTHKRSGIAVSGMCQWKLDTLLTSLVYFLKGYFLFRLINPGSQRHAWRFRGFSFESFRVVFKGTF